jgi:hypothetical protein
MASRIEIATDAVDLVVTDCDVLTAPAHKRASMDAEYRARGRRQRGALSGDSWVSRFLGEVWVNERG